MKPFFGESDRRFRVLVENVHDVITVLAKDGTYIYCSPSVLLTLGFTPDELVGANAFGMIHPSDLSKAAKLFSQIILHPGESFSTQLRYQHKNKSWLWLEGVAINMLNDPQIHGVVVNYRNITERKREEEKTQQRADQMTVLYNTTQDLLVEQDPNRLLHVIVERAVTLLDARGGLLYLCEHERCQIRCVVSYRTPTDYAGTVLKYGEGAAGVVAKTGKPLIIDDYRTWAGRSDLFEIGMPFNAVLSAPIQYQHEMIGVLNILDDHEKRIFNELDLKVASLFANEAAIALANARLIEKVQNHSTELEQRTLELARSNNLLAAFHRIATALMSSHGKEEILNILSKELKTLNIGHEITLYDANTDELVVQLLSADSPLLRKVERLTGVQNKGFRISASAPFISELLETGEARLVNDPLAVTLTISFGIPKPIIRQVFNLILGTPSPAAIYLPLKVGGRKVGLMAVWGHHLKPEDADIFVALTTQVSIALDNDNLMKLESERAAELEKKIAERTKQLQSLLHEKEVLLREVYHRVKNNMQVMNSLLNLQMPRLETQADRQIIADIGDRFRAMSLVHEILYQSGDLAKVDFSEYIRSLVENLARAYIYNTSEIKVTIDIAKIWLGLDTAVPCGLIVNELVANAFKYAFPFPSTVRTREVLVDMHATGEDRYTLTISDNGVGLPSTISWQNSETMGLQLVKMLLEQINAEMRVETNGGTIFTLLFSEVKYKERR